MYHQFFVAIALGAAMTSALGGPGPDEEEGKAANAVRGRLQELGAVRAKVAAVPDACVSRAFPGHRVFSSRFSRYPVERVPPHPLKAQNLFVVGPDGKPKLINDAQGLEEFFRATAAPVKDAAGAKLAGSAWLSLIEELAQDGFYKFQTVDEATKVVDEAGGGKEVTTKAVVMSGGNGEIVTTLMFDASGRLSRAESKVQIKPGPRPRCHATKLLDPDPVVRSIVEQDLLIMGPAAGPYLEEQRAQAAPDLQRAIDRIWQRVLAGER
jgi:hypothetical protein